MPDTSITHLDPYQPTGGAGAHPNDVFVIVDTVDQTMSTYGTDKKLTISQFVTPSGGTPSLFDIAFNPVAQGDLIYRDASAWAVLAPGTSGYILATQGASANPHWVINSVASITGAAPLASPTFTGTVTLSTDTNLVLTDQAAAPFIITTGTTYGTKIGGGTTQKLGFYNATPVVQPTGNLSTALSNLGLVATPSIAVADVTGAAPLASPTFTGTVTMGAGATEADIVVGNSTGTKIGTATSQKLGFYNATPIVQPADTTDLIGGLVNLGLLAATPKITHWTGGITTINCTSGLTAAIDCTSTNAFLVNLYSGGGAHTFTVTNLAIGQTVKITIVQGTTPGTVTSWAGSGGQAIRWAGGTAPTLSTTAANADTITLYSPASGVIGGAVALANF